MNVVKFIEKPAVAGLLKIFLILYASMIAPELPSSVTWLLDNIVTRVLVLFLIALTANKDPGLSIVLALAFVMTINFLKGKGLLEMFRIDQNTNIHTDCFDVKMQDILNVFGGDEQKMHMAMRNAVVPYNVPLTDEFAPLIATYLINKGYDMGMACNLTTKVNNW